MDGIGPGMTPSFLLSFKLQAASCRHSPPRVWDAYKPPPPLPGKASPRDKSKLCLYKWSGSSRRRCHGLGTPPPFMRPFPVAASSIRQARK